MQEGAMQGGAMQGGEGFNRMTVDWRPGPDLAEALARRAPPAAMALDPATLESYRRDGVVLLRGAFADWVEPLRAGLERNLAAPEAYAFPCESNPSGAPGRFFDSYCNWHRIPEYRDFVLGSPAAALAGQLMGARRAQFFHEHCFLKEPGTSRATPWHQDMPYYCVEGTQTASVYVALDAMTEEVAVRFVAGSHRWGKVFYPRVFLDGADFNTEDASMSPVPDIAAGDATYDLRGWDLEPGDTVVFDFRTLHGTGSGLVKDRRRAFSTRWLGDDVVYCIRPGEMSPPLGDIGLKPGDPMPEDCFPVLWRR